MYSFTTIDWIIVASYLLGSLLLGVSLSRKVHTADDFYMGGRRSPWWLIGLSVIATYIGALTFLGGPAWSYTDGFSVIFIHINYPIAIFIVVTLFLPFFYNSGVASIYDYLEHRFGRNTRSLLSGLFLFSNIAYSGIMLYTTALVLQFVTGIDVVVAILIVAAVAMVYTVLGGIAAVIWTDLIQTVILLLGAGIVLYLLVGEVSGGVQASLVELDQAGKVNPFNTSLDPALADTIWSGIIAMSIYHVVVYGVNQMMVQRTLSARTLGDAKKAYIFMGYAAFFIFFLFFFIGILLHHYFDGKVFENGNTIILEFAAQMQFPGLMGILAAAIVAAAMSSLDSSLNSMATVTTVDFYQQYLRREESPEHYLVASRWFTLMWGVLIVVPAIAFMGSGSSVLEILSKVGSFMVGAKLAAYVLGFYSRHTTERGLMVGVAAGFVCLWVVESYFNIAWPWYCPIGGAVSIVVAWCASLALDGRQDTDHPYSIRGQAALFATSGKPLKENGWYVLPGKVDKASYGLLAFFLFSLAILGGFLLWVRSAG